MRNVLWIAAVAFVISGCTSNESGNKPEVVAPGASGAPASATPSAPADAGKSILTSALAATKAEIACAHCVYHVEGVTSCQPAVKVAGQTLVLSGPGAEAVKGNMELCKGPKAVTLDGKIDGKSFVATKLELAK